MNRIYSLVWNRSRQQIKVASELAKGSGGNGSATRACSPGLRRATLALAVLTAISIAPSALAGQTTCLGAGTTAAGTRAVACGYQTTASGTDSTALGAYAKALGGYSTAIGVNAVANGLDSVALGINSYTSVNGYGTALGPGAKAYAANSTALGFGAIAGVNGSATIIDDIAIGGSARATGGNDVAIGQGAVSGVANAVALGTASVAGAAHTDAAAMQVTLNGTTYTFAGPASVAAATVSVGTVGSERQIQNVAAGDITSTSTDAVNGSQLYATNQAVDAIGATASEGWNLSANGGTAVNIAQGATVDVAQGSNIVVTQNATTGDLSIATSATPTFTSVTTGNTVMDSNGVTITGGPNGPVSLTNSGLDNGANVITNVAPGVNPTDAVNVSQLDTVAAGATTEVVAGTNVASVAKTTAGDGHAIYTVNADGSTASAGSAAVTVTPAGPDANNVTDYAVDLSAATKASLGKADTALQSFVTQANGSTAQTVDQTTAQANFKSGQNINVTGDATGITIATANDVVFNSVVVGPIAINPTGLDMGSTSITNLAPGVNPTDAVNLSQLDNAVSGATTHYYSVNDGGTPGGNYNNDGATGLDSIAAGPGAVASSTNSVAIGNNAFAQTLPGPSTGAVAIGDSAHVLGSFGISIGANAAALNGFAIAVGQGATTKFAFDLAIGGGPLGKNGASATGGASIAIGSGSISTDPAFGGPASASGRNAIAIGQNTVAAFKKSIALGFGATPGSVSSVAVGDSATTGATGVNVAVGNASTANAGTAAGGAVAIGRASTAFGDGAVAIGDPSFASGTGAFVGGADNIANSDGTATATAVNEANGAVAIGNGNKAIGQGSVALGNASTAGAAGIAGNVAIGDGATAAASAGDVALGSGSVTAAANPTASATINGTTYTFAGTTPTSVVSVGAAGAERQLSNVAAGQLSATSTDAVNGSQLYATNQAVDAIGATAGEGWNLTTAATGSGVANTVSTASVKPGDTATITADNNIVTTQNGTAVAIGLNPVLTGLTSIAFAGGGPVLSATGIDMGNTSITNLAPGVNPTDAVNVSQLDTAVAGATTHYYSVNDGGTPGGNYNNDGATGLDALASGVAASAIGDDSTALGADAVANNADDVALGAGSVTAAANPVSNVTINGITYSFAGIAPTSVVSVGSVGNERQITNVAAGQLTATSTDAVNGSQLYATNQALGDVQQQINNINSGGTGEFQVSADSTGSPTPSGTNSAAGGANATASGSNSVAVGNDSKASGTGSTALGEGAQATGANSVALGTGSVAAEANTVSVGSAGHERKITNVAAGTAPTDAVNVSQLRASEQGGVQYDNNPNGSTNYNSVTLNPGGGPAVIHNVAAGVADHDAVNVGQLNTAVAGAVTQANGYTDQRFNELKGSLSQIGDRANAGIASAIAAASLPQPYAPDQNSLGVGLGSFHGEAGIAVGLSRISENGHWILKANVSSDTRGDVGAGVGAGIVW